MRFTRRHMWVGAAVLGLAVLGYLAYGAAYRVGYFVGSN